MITKKGIQSKIDSIKNLIEGKKKWIAKYEKQIKELEAIQPKKPFNAKAYWKKNYLKRKEQFEKWRINNPDYYKKNYEKNKAKIKEYMKTYEESWGSGVYLVTCKQGNTYVGYSNRLRARKCQHFSKKIRPDSCIAGIYTAVKFTILEVTKDKSKEDYWIKKLKPTLNTRKVA